jgi:hypothetical protein
MASTETTVFPGANIDDGENDGTHVAIDDVRIWKCGALCGNQD